MYYVNTYHINTYHVLLVIRIHAYVYRSFNNFIIICLYIFMMRNNTYLSELKVIEYVIELDHRIDHRTERRSR